MMGNEWFKGTTPNVSESEEGGTCTTTRLFTPKLPKGKQGTSGNGAQV